MSTDEQILLTIDSAFGDVPRPEHFCDPTHCPECAEHDALLTSRDRSTLQISDVGNEAWDPMCFSSPQGFAYYFPSLARLALAPPTYNFVWYCDQLLSHLFSGAEHNTFLSYCSSEQRSTVAALIAHFISTRTSLPERMSNDDDLARAHTIWSMV
jgi:hypothetical protein